MWQLPIDSTADSPTDTAAPDTGLADDGASDGASVAKTYTASFTSGVAAGPGTSRCVAWNAFRAGQLQRRRCRAHDALDGNTDFACSARTHTAGLRD